MADKIGYDDTPVIKGQTWKVHDCERPQPRIVTSGELATQAAPAVPPSDAIVLFDGTSLDGWESTKEAGAPAAWKVENGYMEVVPGTGDIKSKQAFGSCQLHVEYASPEVVKGDSQGRGNSGVFLMSTYEIQVLDNYNNPSYADGMSGGIYGQWPPLVNACREPGKWQVYDAVWEAPVFDGDNLVAPAYLTLFHNGVCVHNRKELNGPTTHRDIADYKAHPAEMPLKLQDHGDLVRYRSVWYRPLTDYDQG